MSHQLIAAAFSETDFIEFVNKAWLSWSTSWHVQLYESVLMMRYKQNWDKHPHAENAPNVFIKNFMYIFLLWKHNKNINNF